MVVASFMLMKAKMAMLAREIPLRRDKLPRRDCIHFRKQLALDNRDHATEAVHHTTEIRMQ